MASTHFMLVLLIPENNIENWADTLEKAVDFVMFTKKNFVEDTDQERRGILRTLGKNLTTDNGKISVGNRFWREPFKNMMNQMKQKTAGLKPAVFCSQTGEPWVSLDEKSLWWNVIERVRTILVNSEGYVYIPKMRMKAF